LTSKQRRDQAPLEDLPKCSTLYQEPIRDRATDKESLLRLLYLSWKTTPTAEIRATCRFPPVEVVAGSRRKRYRQKARGDPSHTVHSRVVSAHQTRLTDDSLVEASTSGWETKEETRRPELWMPRVRLHALVADRTGHGRFAEYHARFGHDEETVREATCPCGKPLTPSPCDCAFLKGLVQPPLYGHTKSWLR